LNPKTLGAKTYESIVKVKKGRIVDGRKMDAVEKEEGFNQDTKQLSFASTSFTQRQQALPKL
jgi:hypothetical protein